jgi:outer membrane lipoprotein-sorting protein
MIHLNISRQMRTLPITLFCLFHLLTQSGAQDLAAILEDHFNASAQNKMEGVETIVTTGKNMLSSAGVESAFKVYQSRPGKLRIESDFQGSELIQTYNGQTGWTYAPGLGLTEPVELKGQELEAFLNQLQFENPLRNYAERGATLELADPAGTLTAYHLVLTSKDGAMQHFFIDRESHLISAVKSTQLIGGSEAEIEVLLTDYKTVKGIPFAHQVVTKMNGQVVTTTRYERVEVNRKLDPALFEKPAKQ